MRTAPIDLDIEGTQLRVVCDDARGTEMIRATFEEHLVEEPAPLGFFLEVPNEGDRMFVLLERSGLVLGRTRRLDDCLAVLCGHLSAFAPPPIGTARFRMRALVDERGAATVALHPLLQLPPLVERRLASSGHRIVDRLVVDIDRDRRLHLPTNGWSDLPDSVGHVSQLGAPAIIGSLLLPGANGRARSHAQVIAEVATSGSHETCRDVMLAVSEAVAEVGVADLDPVEPDGIYRLLRECSGPSDQYHQQDGLRPRHH